MIYDINDVLSPDTIREVTDATKELLTNYAKKAYDVNYYGGKHSVVEKENLFVRSVIWKEFNIYDLRLYNRKAKSIIFHAKYCKQSKATNIELFVYGNQINLYKHCSYYLIESFMNQMLMLEDLGVI